MYPGRQSYLKNDLVALSAGDYTIRTKADRAIVTDISQKTQRSLGGECSAEITFSGPWSGFWNLQVNEEHAFALGIGNTLFISLTCRVTSIELRSPVRGVVEASVTLDVLDDFLAAGPKLLQF